MGRVSLEDGQPTTVARLLLRHWLNTWLGTARLRAYVRKSHTRLVGNRPQGRLAAQSSSSSYFFQEGIVFLEQLLGFGTSTADWTDHAFRILIF